jgi:tRNA(Ile)-lysidine synthase TilS/MesJ
LTTKTNGCPEVFVVTASGRQQLAADGDERLIDLLKKNGIPWSAVSIYVVPSTGGEPVLSSMMDLPLNEFLDISEILLYYNRNVDPSIFFFDTFRVVNSSASSQHATEYFYQQLDNEGARTKTYLKKLNSEECKWIIAQRVGDTIREHLPYGSNLVVGVSGGGDSNAMLYGLSQLSDHALGVHPVIIKGIPEWDKGVPRAIELCRNYGLNLTIIEENEVKALLGIEDNPATLMQIFESEFSGDDFEFLGTLLVRLALLRHARTVGTEFICTGLNMEDVLCEAVFRISAGMKPAGIPVRTIGNMKLVFPLWLCPKRIIDGCFPKFSLENYEARIPCVSLGRNLYYSIVYALQSQFPGFAEQLAHGVSQMSLKDPVHYTFDEQLGFHVERAVPPELRKKFLRLLGKEYA